MSPASSSAAGLLPRTSGSLPPYPGNIAALRDILVNALAAGPLAGGMYSYSLDGETITIDHKKLVDAIAELDRLYYQILLRQPYAQQLNRRYRGF